MLLERFTHNHAQQNLLLTEQVTWWILSNNVCSMIAFAMDKQFDEGDDECNVKWDTHKEGQQRRKTKTETVYRE